MDPLSPLAPPSEGPEAIHKVPATPPVIAPGHTFGTVTDKISSIVLTRKTPIGWYLGFGTAMMFTLLLLVSLAYLVTKGIGIWGNNIPVGWAFDITNFVWWIGIGHAGTLISAILLLLKQTWRTSINRFAEAMTLFAVACAGIFPLFHTGRPWLAYWLIPYPNTMNVWPQFRSPLIWDVFAVSTYATVSALFWFVGLIPDLATLRDRSQSRAGRAIYSGFAMVLTLAIPIRAVYGLEDFITMRHIQNMAKVMLVTGLIVAYGYGVEAFMAWYSADKFESFVPLNRFTGPYWPFYWGLLACNIVLVQSLWIRRVRTNVVVLFIIALIVNVGMWLERFIIIVTSLHRDFAPSSWGMFNATFWDWSTYFGTIGLFLALLFLFLRFLPMISIAEMRAILPEARLDDDIRVI